MLTFFFPFNKTQAPLRSKCGVYSVSTSSDMLTFKIRKALSRNTLVIADAVMHLTVDVQKLGKMGRKRSKRAKMRHAAPSGQSLLSFATAKSFVSPLFLCLYVR